VKSDVRATEGYVPSTNHIGMWQPTAFGVACDLLVREWALWTPHLVRMRSLPGQDRVWKSELHPPGPCYS
jgi:hypothetical protein